MSAITGGMEDLCVACTRVIGDHTMREFEACTASRSFEIGYGPASDRTLNDRFGIPADVVVADHLVAKATVLEGSAGQLEVKAAGLLLEFGSSASGKVEIVGKVLYIGDVDGVRAAGRLLRDTANGAANAAGGRR